MTQQKLLVIGSSNIDHVVQLSNFPQPGETIQGQGYRIAFGGKGANQAVAAAKLGADTTFITCIGDDAMSDELLGSFASSGIDCQFIQKIGNEMTGVALIWVNEQGENMIALNAGANAALTSQYIEQYQQAIDDADILLCQLETPISGLERAIALAQHKKTFIVLNPAPAQTLPAELFKHIDLLTPNETEAEILTGVRVSNQETAQQATQCLHDKGVQEVIITMGAKGVFYANHKGESQWYEAFTVKAVDTTAAGDTFNGGLVAALSNGATIKEAIRYGQAAAALSVQTFGAQPSIPPQQVVTAFLQAHK